MGNGITNQRNARVTSVTRFLRISLACLVIADALSGIRLLRPFILPMDFSMRTWPNRCHQTVYL